MSSVGKIAHPIMPAQLYREKRLNTARSNYTSAFGIYRPRLGVTFPRLICGEGKARHPNSCSSISNPQLLLLFYLYSSPSFLRVLHFRSTRSCARSLTREGGGTTWGARTRAVISSKPRPSGGHPRPAAQGHRPRPVHFLHSWPRPPSRFPAGREGPWEGAQPPGRPGAERGGRRGEMQVGRAPRAGLGLPQSRPLVPTLSKGPRPKSKEPQKGLWRPGPSLDLAPVFWESLGQPASRPQLSHLPNGLQPVSPAALEGSNDGSKRNPRGLLLISPPRHLAPTSSGFPRSSQGTELSEERWSWGNGSS